MHESGVEIARNYMTITISKVSIQRRTQAKPDCERNAFRDFIINYEHVFSFSYVVVTFEYGRGRCVVYLGRHITLTVPLSN